MKLHELISSASLEAVEHNLWHTVMSYSYGVLQHISKHMLFTHPADMEQHLQSCFRLHDKCKSNIHSPFSHFALQDS